MCWDPPLVDVRSMRWFESSALHVHVHVCLFAKHKIRNFYSTPAGQWDAISDNSSYSRKNADRCILGAL